MTTPINNIDLFNASAAIIFSELYKNVPVPTALNYSQLSSSIIDDSDELSRANALVVFINTITWLKKSGFIWLDSEGELDAFGALLSPKGLEVLSIVPDSPDQSITIGARLTTHITSGDTEELATLVTIAISAGIKIP